jgi:hypothetical protein
MRMKGARKDAQGMITESGNMVIYVAGYPAIMGLQPLYFKGVELAPPRPDIDWLMPSVSKLPESNENKVPVTLRITG